MLKLVPKVNTDGLYIEDELVDDSFTGVVPFYEQDTAEPAGYTVGVPLTVTGLYKPRFDLAGWKAYQDVVSRAWKENQAACDKWAVLPEKERGEAPIYVAPTPPDHLWIEGFTPEQIAELTKPAAAKPTELENHLRDLRAAVAELATMISAGFKVQA